MSDGTASTPPGELAALHMMNFARGMENNQRTLNHAQALGEAQLKKHFGADFTPAEREDMNFAYNSPSTIHNHYSNPDSAAISPSNPVPAQPPAAEPREPEPPGIISRAIGSAAKAAIVASMGGAAGVGLMLAAQLLKPAAEPPVPATPPAVIEQPATPPAPAAPPPFSDTDTHYQLRLPNGTKPDVPN